MNFDERVRRIKWVFLGLLGLVPLHLLLFGLSQLEQLNTHALNSRLGEKVELRGRLLDRKGRALAQSAGDRRHYPAGELAAHWSGYHHSQRGMGGGERWKNELLRDRRLPGRRDSERGRDIRFSLDLDRQRRLRGLMPENELGAALLIELDSGQLLAAVSVPEYSPARAGADWLRWQQDERAPLLNRCTLGLYPASQLEVALRDRLGTIRQCPPALMDWTQPHSIAPGVILLSPAQVGAAILGLGTPLRLSQIFSEFHQTWGGQSELRRRLKWVRLAGAWAWAGQERYRSQVVTWTLAQDGKHLVVVLLESPCSLDECRQRALRMLSGP